MIKCESIEDFIHTTKAIGTRLFRFHVEFFKSYYEELRHEIKDLLLDKNN